MCLIDRYSGIPPFEVERSIDDGGISSPSLDIAHFIGARRWCKHSLRSRFVPRPGLVSLRQIFVRPSHTGDFRKQFATASSASTSKSSSFHSPWGGSLGA